MSRDHDLGAPLDIPQLGTFRSSSEHAGASETATGSELLRDLLNLLSQLSGRSKNQDNRSISPLQVGLVVRMDNPRKKISKSLPRASLSDPHHVNSSQSDGPSLGLDRSGRIKPSLPDLSHDVVGEVSVLKVGDGVRDGVSALNGDFFLISVLLYIPGIHVEVT